MKMVRVASEASPGSMNISTSAIFVAWRRDVIASP